MTNDKLPLKNSVTLEDFQKIFGDSQEKCNQSDKSSNFNIMKTSMKNNESMFLSDAFKAILAEIQEFFPKAKSLDIVNISVGMLKQGENSSIYFFTESSQGTYLLVKYIGSIGSDSFCVLFPIKGDPKNRDNLLKTFYHYNEDNVSQARDFSIDEPAKFNFELTPDAEIKLELTRHGKLIAKPESLQKTEVSPKNETDDLENKILGIEEEIQALRKEIESKNEQLSQGQEMSSKVNEIHEMLTDLASHQKNVEQTLEALYSSQTIGKGSGDNILQRSNRTNSQHIEINSLANSSSNKQQSHDLDSQMIKILKWYQQNQYRPEILEQYAQKVSEIEDSFNARRSGASVAIVLAPASNHSFLIYNDYYMFPRPDSKITNPKLNTFEACFECENFSSGAAFEVLKPAIVSKLSVEDDRWQLQERGKLKFL